MDLHKIIHDIYEASKHWHLPFFFAGFITTIKVPKRRTEEKLGDIGDTPGDNIIFLNSYGVNYKRNG